MNDEITRRQRAQRFAAHQAVRVGDHSEARHRTRPIVQQPTASMTRSWISGRKSLILSLFRLG
jgi:hypothetical protein